MLPTCFPSTPHTAPLHLVATAGTKPASVLPLVFQSDALPTGIYVQRAHPCTVTPSCAKAPSQLGLSDWTLDYSRQTYSITLVIFFFFILNKLKM